MINFKFDLLKTIEASAIVLLKNNGCMDYMRLLKILYIADRELLIEAGKILTGDQPYAMKYGPVLSETYRNIKNSQNSEWNQVIETMHYQVYLKTPIVHAKLNQEEILKLNELCERYKDKDSFELSELTHEFEEWQHYYDKNSSSSSTLIEWDKVLEVFDMQELSVEINANLIQEELFDHLFG